MNQLFTKRDLSYCMDVMNSTGEGLVAGILFRCARTVSDEVPTAGVMFAGGKFHLIVNPEFMGGLKKSEQLGVLMHEALHLVFQHCTARNQPDRKLHVIHNYATDCAINSIITGGLTGGDRSAALCKLPKMGIVPGRASQRPTDEKWDKMSEDDRAWFQKFSDFIEALPPMKSSEWYFEKFLEDEDIKEMLTSPSLEDILGDMLLDDHEGWGTTSDEEREAAQAKIKEILARVVNKCQKTGQWGSISADTQEMIAMMLRSQVDWRKQLRSWVGMTRRGNRSTTWRRPNKRCPGRMTSSRTAWTASLLIAMDESGSVSNEEMDEGFAEFAGMSRHRSFDILPFDSSVQPDRLQKVKKKGGFTPVRTLAGGTSFHAVMEYAGEHRSEYDGLIIFTDGEASDPGPPLRGMRRLWLISSRGKLAFKPHPGDTVIQLLAHGKS